MMVSAQENGSLVFLCLPACLSSSDSVSVTLSETHKPVLKFVSAAKLGGGVYGQKTAIVVCGLQCRGSSWSVFSSHPGARLYRRESPERLASMEWLGADVVGTNGVPTEPSRSDKVGGNEKLRCEICKRSPDRTGQGWRLVIIMRSHDSGFLEKSGGGGLFFRSFEMGVLCQGDNTRGLSLKVLRYSDVPSASEQPLVSCLCLISCPCCPRKDDTKWALYRGSVPREGKCLQCVTIQKKAYPSLDWNGCKLQYATAAELRKEWEVAQKILEGMSPHFTRSSFDAVKGICAEVEKRYRFIPELYFGAFFGVESKEVGKEVDFDYVENKKGELMKGLLVEKDPYYDVTVVSRQGTVLSTHLQPSCNQLRPSQASETATWYHTDMLRSWTSGLTKPRSQEAAASMLKKSKEEKERKSAESSDARSVAQAPQQLSDGDQQMEEPDEDYSAAIPSLVLPSSAQAKGKAKAKGDKKRSEKDKGASASARSPAVKKSRVSKPSESSTAAAGDTMSVASLALSEVSQARNLSPSSRSQSLKPSASPWSSLVTGAVKYTSIMELSAALSNTAIGHLTNQARRIHRAMEATSPGSSEAVTLKAKLDLVELAQEIACVKLHYLDTQIEAMGMHGRSAPANDDRGSS